MPKQPPPSAIADKFMLRLPDGMRDRIATEAAANSRSMNAEIILRLDKSLIEVKKVRDKYLGMSETEFRDEIMRSVQSAANLTRMPKPIQAAIDKAAKDHPDVEGEGVAMMEHIVEEWLRERGYLK